MGGEAVGGDAVGGEVVWVATFPTQNSHETVHMK